MRQPVLWPLALPMLVGCRVNFDRVPDAQDSDGAPDAAPPVLVCGAPSEFPMAAMAAGPGLVVDPVGAFAAAATRTGYYAFATDDTTGEVRGFSFTFDGGRLVPGQSFVRVFGAAATGGGLAAVGVGDSVMAAVVYAQPGALGTAVGTALVPLDGDLRSLGSPQMQPDWFGLDSTMAHAPDGTLAFLGMQSSADVTAKLVSPTGMDVGSSHVAIDRSENAKIATITESGTGFLVTWGAGPTPASNIHAELLDQRLNVMPGSAVTINPGATFAGNEPRAAYAAAADRYLFAWWFKDTTHELWVSLRDNKLAEISSFVLTLHGDSPRVAVGKDSFLVAWRDDGYASGLAAARVKFDGTFTSLAVGGRGGKVARWDVVTRAGQPALVWLESGTVPTLWLDPLCN